MTKLSLLLVLITSVYFISCRTEAEERITKGEEYFPLKTGDLKFYAIDTIVYNLFERRIDTITSIVREEVVELFLDASLDTVYRIELSTYSIPKVEWVVFKSYERKVKDNYALEKMENSTEVKMLFPIAQYKTKGSSYTWNANMFNNKEPVMVKYSSVFTSFHNGINPYNDCVSIKMNKPQTGVINSVKEEVYARNIGLVYRFTDSTDYLQDSSFPSGKKTIIRLKN